MPTSKMLEARYGPLTEPHPDILGASLSSRLFSVLRHPKGTMGGVYDFGTLVLPFPPSLHTDLMCKNVVVVPFTAFPALQNLFSENSLKDLQVLIGASKKNIETTLVYLAPLGKRELAEHVELHYEKGKYLRFFTYGSLIHSQDGSSAARTVGVHIDHKGIVSIDDLHMLDYPLDPSTKSRVNTASLSTMRRDERTPVIKTDRNDYVADIGDRVFRLDSMHFDGKAKVDDDVLTLLQPVDPSLQRLLQEIHVK